MSPYGRDVIMFHVRNPCGRFGEKNSPHVPSGGHDLHMITYSFALRRIWSNTMLTTR